MQDETSCPLAPTEKDHCTHANSAFHFHLSIDALPSLNGPYRFIMEKRFQCNGYSSSVTNTENQNSRDATRSLSFRRRDKARRVRSDDSIPLFNILSGVYGLHTKVIYPRNSFRFDFKWSELTADSPTTRTVVAGEREREKSSDDHRFPRSVEKRLDITGSMRRRSFLAPTCALFTEEDLSSLFLLASPSRPDRFDRDGPTTHRLSHGQSHYPRVHPRKRATAPRGSGKCALRKRSIARVRALPAITTVT